MRKLLIPLFFTLWTSVSFAQLCELRIYNPEGRESASFKNISFENYNSINENILNKIEKASPVILDFEYKIEQREVLLKKEKDGKTLRLYFNQGEWHGEFFLENKKITKGNIHIKDQKFDIKIFNENGKRVLYLVESINTHGTSSMRLRPYSLHQFTDLSQTNQLLEIWGEEADYFLQIRNGRDNNSPIFYGCYDWHSSVHGQFSALATGHNLDISYLKNNTTARYTATKVIQEKNYNSNGEVTYGYPWYLLYMDYLAEKEPQSFETMKPLTNQIYQKVKNHILNNTSYVSSQYYNSLEYGYGNYNFMLLGLYTYAKRINDETTMNHVRQFLQAHAPNVNWNQIQAKKFLDPKAIAALLYVKTGMTSGTAWDNLKSAYDRDPLSLPWNFSYYSAYGMGVYLSKTWGAWTMYKQTGEQRYLTAYINILNGAYQQLKAKKGTGTYFSSYGHWLPNFGAFALILQNQENNDNSEETPVTPTEPTEPEVVIPTNITVSPNPFTSYIEVDIPSSQNGQIAKIEIINWAKWRVFSKNATVNKGVTKITLNNLGYLWPENYVLRVYVNGKTYQKQINKSGWW